MLEHVEGNLLRADVEALVNTVNTVGVMGKGIALQFKQAFAGNYKAYREACRDGSLVPGRMLVVPTGAFVGVKWIINFPTKRHWKGNSRLEDIESGLPALVGAIQHYQIASIAIPPLGCGNGGLDWSQVRPLIVDAMGQIPDVRVLLYAPAGSPSPADMPVNTAPPKWTQARAALVCILGSYLLPGYELTMLEVQKLAYFLQEAGEPLRLHFVKFTYGPYAEALHHVLQRLEGHFIRGYGDRSREATITVNQDAVAQGQHILSSAGAQTLQRKERVVELIEGFETPYGLELLSSVHWVAREDAGACHDWQGAVGAIHEWNEHKRRTFKAAHIKLAWERLHDLNWLPTAA